MASRFYLLHGTIDVGYIPNTDGYGNVDVGITIVFTYGSEYMVLNKDEIEALFNTITMWDIYRKSAYLSLHDKGIYDDENGYGKFIAKKIDEEHFHLIHTSNEGELTGINDFKTTDMEKLFDIHRIVRAKVHFMAYKARHIIDEIDKIAFKYRDNTKLLIYDASNWGNINDTLIEIAGNFMDFYGCLVREMNNNVTQ